MIAEVKGRRQIMLPEPMEGIDDNLVHPDTEEDEEDGTRSKYWP